MELSSLIDDLGAESDTLDALVADLPADRWQTLTPSAPWTIAHQIAHLAWTDAAAIAAARAAVGYGTEWDALVTGALGSPDTVIDDAAEAGSRRAPAELLDSWRTGRRVLADALADVPDGAKMPWLGPPMRRNSMITARMMETWAHGQDVADALGTTWPVTDRLRHVAHIGVRTRDYAFGVHDRPAPAEEFRVELAGPRGDVWTWGPADAAQQVAGPALDFCLLVTRRRHRDDLRVVAIGPDADAWLDIAQAFAGPPGPGRRPV